MILTEKIEVRISHNNIKHYSTFFENLKIGQEIEINPDKLLNGSHHIILSKCDICGNEKNIPYRDYIKSLNNGNIFTCNKCKNFKVKKTKLKKYGNENYNNTDKNKKTCLNKYGSENVFQNDIIKEKIKEKNLKKYGVEFISQVKEIKEKSKKTNLEKYGTEHHLQNKDILNKQYKTNLERYGFEHVSQNKEIMKKIISKSKDTRKKTFIKKYKNLNPLNIDYDNQKIRLKCDNNLDHYFDIDIDLFNNRKILRNTLCTICNPVNSSSSDIENKLKIFIKENYNGEIIENDRSLGIELDIYLPEIKIALEYNELYWHSELFKEKNYHKNKTDISEENNIRLIHIYEDQYINKTDIVHSMILNLLGKSNKIFARKCEIREIQNNKIVKDFLLKNHLQGYCVSKIKIGLFYENELISLMTLSKNRKSLNQKSEENKYEITRYCNKLQTNVVGGASKLFKYFIEKYKPLEVISYADRSWSIGNLYKKLGFKLLNKTNPGYFYFKNKNRYHRFNFRKYKLIKEGADPLKTEHDIMIEKGYYKIYDSGQLKFIWTS